jgi:peptidoglycan/xylan/chitin deacetylase (PgdA/CDA1 family)
MGLTDERTQPLPRRSQLLEPRPAPAVSRLRTLRTTLFRTGKATFRLFLNWGVLLAAVAAALVVRDHVQAQARAPLPPPVVQLSAADTAQWQGFPSYRRDVPVLLYHGVSSSNGGLSISRQVFAEQMLALRTAGFHAITLAQYVNFVNGDRKGLPAKPILLTFDDGRLATYRAVNEILRKYGFHATMFTFASWPTTTPGYSLTWKELRAMQRSGTWSVEEAGGEGHGYLVYDAAGDRGAVYAYREYTSRSAGQAGHLEGFPAFLRRVTSNILWGTHQLSVQLPNFRPLAFAVPGGNYGQLATNDTRIPQFMLPWLAEHFQMVFGGDYLDRGPNRPFEIKSRFSLGKSFSFRISLTSRVSLAALKCRLTDWVTRAPVSKEYGCLRSGPSGAGLAVGPTG